jgi:hypothetical protein
VVGHGLLGIRPSNYNGSNTRVSKMTIDRSRCLVPRYCKVCKKLLIDTLLLCAGCTKRLGDEEDYTDPQMDLFGDD